MWHSCGRYRISDHFAGADAIVRKLYREIRKVIVAFGGVTAYAQKTRIVFQTRGRFVALFPRKRWLDGHVWLKRKAIDPRFNRIESLADRDFVHHFRLTDPVQIDAVFVSYLREAYDVGSQSRMND